MLPANNRALLINDGKKGPVMQRIQKNQNKEEQSNEIEPEKDAGNPPMGEIARTRQSQIPGKKSIGP